MLTLIERKETLALVERGHMAAIDKLLREGIGRPTQSITDAAVTLTAAHARDLLLLNRAGGITFTLPAAVGSGLWWEFLVQTTFTSDGVIQVANATDIIQGGLGIATDAAGTTVPALAASDTITMNGSTTGGVKGSRIKIEDVASGLFMVSGQLVSTGAEATPFSADVS